MRSTHAYCFREALPGVSTTAHLSFCACWDQGCQQEDSCRLLPSLSMPMNGEKGHGPAPVCELGESSTLGTWQLTLDKQAGSFYPSLKNPCPECHTTRGN